MKDALTPEQRADLMRKAGIPADLVAKAEPATVMPVIEEEPELFTGTAIADALVDALAERPETIAVMVEAATTGKPVHATIQPEPKPKKAKRAKQTAGADDLGSIAKALCESAKGDKSVALDAVDAHVQVWFDARKLSTKQAAAKGIERSEHNKPLWAAAQDMRSALKTLVRKHFASEGGFVKAKVKAHVPTTSVEQFLAAQGVQDPNVSAFLGEFTKFINAQKGEASE